MAHSLVFYYSSDGRSRVPANGDVRYHARASERDDECGLAERPGGCTMPSMQQLSWCRLLALEGSMVSDTEWETKQATVAHTRTDLTS